MSLWLLALNVGSASLKAASYVLSRDTGTRETGRITVDGFRMDDVRDASPMPASEPVALLSSVMAQLPSLREPDRIVHRIVHGGDRSSPLELTAPVLDELDAWSSHAPLHARVRTFVLPVDEEFEMADAVARLVE